MSNLLAKMDGFKSIAGLLIVVAFYAVPAFGGPILPPFLLNFGASLAGVGLLAKLEKGTGVLTSVVGYAQKALDVLGSVIKAIAPTPVSK